MPASVVGADAELAALEDFLAGIRDGASALVLEGEAGMGKTTLWSAALEQARADGFVVLRAQPAGSETALNRRILTTAAAVGTTLALGVPTALGSGEPIRDHGDASQAKLAVQPWSIGIVRDYGDASQAKLMTQSSPALEIARDHGDATHANLQLQSPPMEVIRDRGDATQAKPWSAPVVARENVQRVEGRSTPVIVRDHGDATQAKLAARSSGTSPVRELESTSGGDLNWSQLAIGFGVAMFVVLGVILALQLARNQRLAH